MSYYSIAIDGPAGAGKSTIAKLVSRELGYIYVDTGAMYRALALYCIENDFDFSDLPSIGEKIQSVQVAITYIEGEQQIILNGRNVTAFIRSNEVSKAASLISANPQVRLKLVELQRDLARVENVVMDGRDIGTHVLKDATLKIYMSASAKVRGKRRWLELKERGEDVDLEMITDEIERRDYQDMHREFSPLCQAEDAVYIDTSELSVEVVVQVILNYFYPKCKKLGE